MWKYSLCRNISLSRTILPRGRTSKSQDYCIEMVLFQVELILILGGYWIYHKNKVDLTHMYSNPEEKLWYVVKHYQGKTPYKGFRLEKNAIVKFGRVRLRVRDIDYKDQESDKVIL